MRSSWRPTFQRRSRNRSRSPCKQTTTQAVYWVYELEVTAVEEDFLYLLVTLKGTRDQDGRWLRKNDVSRGDIGLQMRNGDCVSGLLGMAVAVRGLGEKCYMLPETDTLRACYDEYLSRLEESRADVSPPRI
jgi:hypothetical protein